MIDKVKSESIPRLIEFYPFDLYEGKGIEEGKKSVAFLILIQDTYKTLEEQEVNNIVDRILKLLQNKFGATLR